MFFVVVSCVLLRDYSTKRQISEEVESLINNNERLKRVDELCKSIPKPKSWKFVEKYLGGNSNTARISYRFQTDLSSNDFDKLDLGWFKKNGWNPMHENSFDFRKNSQTIDINGTNQSVKIVLSCAERY